VDVFSPLSALDAFSICLTSFATNVGLEPWATEEVFTKTWYSWLGLYTIFSQLIGNGSDGEAFLNLSLEILWKIQH
jgi:hypothetical protein